MLLRAEPPVARWLSRVSRIPPNISIRSQTSSKYSFNVPHRTDMHLTLIWVDHTRAITTTPNRLSYGLRKCHNTVRIHGVSQHNRTGLPPILARFCSSATGCRAAGTNGLEMARIEHQPRFAAAVLCAMCTVCQHEVSGSDNPACRAMSMPK